MKKVLLVLMVFLIALILGLESFIHAVPGGICLSKRP